MRPVTLTAATLLWGFIALLVAGCEAPLKYVQPALPDQQVGIIRPWREATLIYPCVIRIGWVDGAVVPYDSLWGWPSARVLPGEHVVAVEVASPNTHPTLETSPVNVGMHTDVDWTKLPFKYHFLAGHVYEVRLVRTGHSKSRLVFVDVTTGAEIPFEQVMCQAK